MPAYLVTLDRSKGGRTLAKGADAMVVFATDATAALQACSAQFDGDGRAWLDDGTATAIVAGTTWIGWLFTIRLSGGITVSQLGIDASSDTIDEIAALLVTALNATAIDNASYNSTTNVLTVAGAADNLGAQKLFVEITPPGAKSPMPALVGTIVDGGVAGAAITVVLPADAYVIPSVPVPVIQT